ncbi:hypothetical protein VTN77DRAFT_2672 [Rasamsonia byssochlamydoides]|uniref:uncharacterized protein n=1 Tax=Rasamsonia byssochlamydoides TaxID=89139 RepID=UPI0037438B03
MSSPRSSTSSTSSSSSYTSASLCLRSTPMSYAERPTHQKEMIDACASGDLPKLQNLFRQYNIKQGDHAIEWGGVEPEDLYGPPPTATLIEAAVAQKHPAIVAFLLSTYPDVQVYRSDIVHAALDNPHVETFQLLHAHDPSIVNFLFDDYLSNILTAACQSSDLQLAYYLLDNGADPNPNETMLGSALASAIWTSQPLELIVKIAERGGWITHLTFNQAIFAKRLDILRLFVDRCADFEFRWLSVSALRKTALQTYNWRIISLVLQFIRAYKKGSRRIAAGTVGKGKAEKQMGQAGSRKPRQQR